MIRILAVVLVISIGVLVTRRRHSFYEGGESSSASATMMLAGPRM